LLRLNSEALQFVMNQDMYLSRGADQSWVGAVLESDYYRFLYPDEKEELLEWARNEDEKRSRGVSLVNNEYYIPAKMGANQAYSLKVQTEGIRKKADNAKRESELEELRIASELLYKTTVKGRRMSDANSLSQPAIRTGPRGGRYTEARTSDGRPYRKYF
jgi:hypothetical protein